VAMLPIDGRLASRNNKCELICINSYRSRRIPSCQQY
jgi:hypothetical protein